MALELGDELQGTFVVSLEQAVAAPYCGLLLADAGARVIKVERPEGDFARGYDAGADGQSAIFAWLNRGKESVCLNLKEDADLKVLKAMLGQADVLLCNLMPGALGRMGLGAEALRGINPRLITCEISGYGPSEAAASKKAYDFLVQGEAGISAVTGTPEAPARVGVPITDLATGLTAFSAILRGLLKRGQTGQGAHLHISMFDVMADWMNMPLLQHRYAEGAPERSGLMHTFVAPYGAFDCGEGGQVLLSVQSNREFAVLCDKVLEQPELAHDARFVDNPTRYKHRDALSAIVTRAFRTLSVEAVIAKLDAAGIANARLNSVAEVSEHPFLRNATGQIGGYGVEMAALPVAGAGKGEVPELDQHGAFVRAEFGDAP